MDLLNDDIISQIYIFFKTTFVCDSSIQWKGRSGAVVYGAFFVSDFTDIHISWDLHRVVNLNKTKTNGTTILERGLPICGLRPNHNHVCEVSQ
jgi:hypothetical protein